MGGEAAELLCQIAKDDERHAQSLLDMRGIAQP